MNLTESQVLDALWFSTTQSFFVCVLLMCMTIIVTVTSVRGFNASTPEQRKDLLKTLSWKALHHDVFRPPAYPLVFFPVVCCGTQILGGLIFILANQTITWTILAHVTAYTTSYMYIEYTEGYSNVLAVALALCTTANCMIFTGDGIDASLAVCGCVFGLIVSTHNPKYRDSHTVETIVPRTIPDHTWIVWVGSTLLGMILPFGPIHVILHLHIHNIPFPSHWYPFLFGIYIATCSMISVSTCMFLLQEQDYRWWWFSVFVTGVSGVSVFLYALYFHAVTVPMVLASLGCFLVAGAVGYISCQVYVTVLYQSLKIE